MTASIRVNGEARALSAPTVVELLRQESLDPDRRGIAVALNGAVLPRRAWPETALAPGDVVEIVKPFAGG
jgi:sulfur carrier protein